MYAEGPRVEIGRIGMFADGSIHAGLCLAAVSFEGNRDTAEVQCEASVLLRIPDSWAVVQSGVLGGDSHGGLFHRAGGESLTGRTGWSAREAPDVTTIAADVHPHGRDAWAIQFLGEAGADGRKREGGLFASLSVPAFKAGETVTFGVPWLSAHHELTLTFPVEGLVEVNRAVRAGQGGIDHRRLTCRRAGR